MFCKWPQQGSTSASANVAPFSAAARCTTVAMSKPLGAVLIGTKGVSQYASGQIGEDYPRWGERVDD